VTHARARSFAVRTPVLARAQVLLDVMVRVEVKEGDVVIRQGDAGDRFYIIDAGVFEVRVTQEDVSLKLALQIAVPRQDCCCVSSYGRFHCETGDCFADA
jgi:CRP-like cAMP-binding protein